MTDISQALRELLLARAAGQIDAEEFERRQAALHAELLAPAPAPLSPAPATAVPAPGIRWWPWAVGVVVVAGAAGLYAWFGTPQGAVPAPPPPMASPMPPMTEMPKAGAGGDLKVMAGRLAEKLVKDPKNGEGWALLAQTYLELRQHKDAAAAFAKAAALVPPDAKMLAEWADAHVVANDRKWDKEARDLVARALAADPKNVKALALAGSEAFDRAEYKQAIAFWKRMKAAAPPDSMDVKLAETNIEEATALMSGKKPASPAPAAAAGGATIAGTVSIDAALKAKAGPTAVVFVVAKATDGSRAPLAVKRYPVAELPAAFKLGDEDAMVPTRALSRFGEAQVSARLSKGGDAMPQPEDVTSATQTVKVGAADVKLNLK